MSQNDGSLQGLCSTKTQFIGIGAGRDTGNHLSLTSKSGRDNPRLLFRLNCMHNYSVTLLFVAAAAAADDDDTRSQGLFLPHNVLPFVVPSIISGNKTSFLSMCSSHLCFHWLPDCVQYASFFLHFSRTHNWFFAFFCRSKFWRLLTVSCLLLSESKPLSHGVPHSTQSIWQFFP